MQIRKDFQNTCNDIAPRSALLFLPFLPFCGMLCSSCLGGAAAHSSGLWVKCSFVLLLTVAWYCSPTLTIQCRNYNSFHISVPTFAMPSLFPFALREMLSRCGILNGFGGQRPLCARSPLSCCSILHGALKPCRTLMGRVNQCSTRW